MSYLLAISLGPVQDFIAAGRKTRDLWAGSALLSMAASAAAAEIMKDVKATLIFPHPETLTAYTASDTSVANKILAIVPDDPAGVAGKAEAAARKVLTIKAVDLRKIDRLTGDFSSGRIDGDRLDRQAKEFLEWYAAWVAYAPETYHADRERVERLLAGRKALRNFEAADGDMIPKSSLDPSRETVVHLERITDATTLERARGRLRLKGDEQLDGVSLIKRLDEAAPRFISVSRVAAEPFIRSAANAASSQLGALRTAAEAIEKTAKDESSKQRHVESPVERFPSDSDSGLGQFDDFPYDSQLLFLEQARIDANLPKDAEVARALKGPVNDFLKARDAVKAVLKAAGLNDSIPAYFAVVVADGDRMGAAIGRMQEHKEHQKLSESLNDFATKAGELTGEHNGALVYSGGDDVLAFLPLNTVLEFADELRRAFDDIVGSVANFDNTPEGERASLSVGVSIAHYGEPLDDLLKWGRDAEHAAKRAGRDALAVSLRSRSGGGQRTVVHHWPANPVPERWQTWITLHQRGDIPDGAAYELDRLAREMSALGATHAIADLTRREAIRILMRKRASDGREPVNIEPLVKVIPAFPASHELASLSAEDQAKRIESVAGAIPKALRTLVDELLIAKRIASVLDPLPPRADPVETTQEGAASDGDSHVAS